MHREPSGAFSHLADGIERSRQLLGYSSCLTVLYGPPSCILPITFRRFPSVPLPSTQLQATLLPRILSHFAKIRAPFRSHEATADA